MITYKLDTITKHKDDHVAYVHVMDGEKIVQTISMIYKDKTSFKKELLKKTEKIRQDYTIQEKKRAEIEEALTEVGG